MSDVRMSPYELFGLPETYALDETLLAERHRAAMQKVHPDRFADRSAAERRVAEQWSAVINEAFETLKSPVKRAVWLAKKRGAEVETEGQVRMPADFLMKQLDWRERLEEADAASREALLGEVESEAKALEEVRKEFGSIGILSQEEKRRLLNAARAAKEALTDAEEAPLTVTLADGKTTTLTLTRKTFVDLTCHLVRKTIDAVGRVLHDADVKTDDIRGIVLVGGATRMPIISQCVERAFGLKPLNDIDPDQVVAVGAAMQANKLVGNASGDDWLLLDVTPLSLGLETMGGLVEKVIPRNSPIPIARAQDFTTFRDGQTAMAIHVVQGEREVVDACRSLARFELRGIPPMAAGAARIRVTFEVDADGLLSVSAREQETGVEASVTVKPSYGLSDEEIVRMLRDGTGSAAADMAARELREQQVEARRLLESTHSALKADGDLLSPEERAKIDGFVETLSGLVTSDDADAIRNAIETLSKETESFAARRMNRSILAALAGHSVDDFASEGKE